MRFKLGYRQVRVVVVAQVTQQGVDGLGVVREGGDQCGVAQQAAQVLVPNALAAHADLGAVQQVDQVVHRRPAKGVAQGQVVGQGRLRVAQWGQAFQHGDEQTFVAQNNRGFGQFLGRNGCQQGSQHFGLCCAACGGVQVDATSFKCPALGQCECTVALGKAAQEEPGFVDLGVHERGVCVPKQGGSSALLEAEEDRFLGSTQGVEAQKVGVLIRPIGRVEAGFVAVGGFAVDQAVVAGFFAVEVGTQGGVKAPHALPLDLEAFLPFAQRVQVKTPRVDLGEAGQVAEHVVAVQAVVVDFVEIRQHRGGPSKKGIERFGVFHRVAVNAVAGQPQFHGVHPAKPAEALGGLLDGEHGRAPRGTRQPLGQQIAQEHHGALAGQHQGYTVKLVAVAVEQLGNGLF